MADYNKALGVHQNEFRLSAVPASHGHQGRPAATFAGTAQPTTLPTGLGKFVLSVLGLTSYPAAISNAVHTPALPHGVRPAATQKGNLTPADFASRYHLTPLQQAGHLGQGQTIGIVTLASMRTSDATHFWSTTLKIKTKANRIKLDNVDGGAGKVSLNAGSGETTLDVEQSGALAPDASIDVYQAPNTDGGFIDGFATAASQDQAARCPPAGATRRPLSTSARHAGTGVRDLRPGVQRGLPRAGRPGPELVHRGRRRRRLRRLRATRHHQPVGRRTRHQPVHHRRGRHHAARHHPGGRPGSARSSAASGPGAGTGCGRPCDSAPPSEKSFAWSRTSLGGGGGFSAVERTPFYQTHWPSAHQFSAVST